MEVSNPMKNRRIAELVLIAMTTIWGGTFVIVKTGLADASPITFVAVRFWFATIIFTVLFRKKIRLITRPVLIHGIILGILLFIGFAGQTYGLTLTTASKSGFITGMLVIFTPLAQLIIERRAPGAGNIVGIIFVSIGLWILTSPQGSGFNAGDLTTLAAAVIWGIYIVYLDVFSKTDDGAQLTFLQVGTTAVASTLMIPFVETPYLSATTNLLVALIYTAVLATVLTTYAQTRFQKDTTPTRAAVIYSLEPVIAAILAYILLGERIGSLGLLGGGLIFLGLLISELSDGIRALARRLGIGAAEETEHS